MEKGCYVKDIAANAEAGGVFAIIEAAQGQSRNGPYWRLTLGDATGNVEAKIWSPLSAAFDHLPTGALAWVEGRGGLYRDQVQLTVEALRLLTGDEQAGADMADFLPSSPFPLDAMMDDLMEGVRREFTHAPWRKLVQSFFADASLRAAFRVCPAAKSVHHAYAGGLLEHTLGVFNLCRRMADQYQDLDRQTLLAGAIFHDIGKMRELSGGFANDYTDEGRLLGHMALGLEMLRPFLDKSGLDPALVRHFQHLILSHHGEPEFGAARLPQSPEALALHYADNMDAKMAQCRSLFAQMSGGEGWTPWQKTLERAMFRAARTPAKAASENRRKKAEGALSLLD